MDIELDETLCGPLCQHPSCWESQKRLYKGKPRYTPRNTAPTIQHEEGLPTQNIVNLLDAYGDEQHEYCPPKHVNRRTFSSSSSATALYSSNRPPSRDSYPKMKTPMVTPASLLQSSSVNIGETTPQHSEAPIRNINKVEVQEVFDLDDLRSDWHDTFVARQYYVWVPNPNATKEKSSQAKSGQLGESNVTILPKDMTEEMLPKQVGWERNVSKMKRNLGSPKTPQQGLHLQNRSAYSGRSAKEYYRDLVDREHLVDALIKAFPQLEHQNCSLSMAYGDVLQQYKLELHNDRPPRRLQRANQINIHTAATKQIYVMDIGSHGQSQYVHIPSELLSKTASPATKLSPLKQDVQTGMTRSDAKQLSQRHPLPSISTNHSDNRSPRSVKVASVSLGLPQLPSGVKITRPFAYNQKYLDLTLGPVTDPLPFDTVPKSPNVPPSSSNKATQSPVMSDKASSIIVTMPTVPAEHTDLSRNISAADREITDATDKTEPLHAVSPSYSTNVPNAPAGTPAMRQSAGLVKELSGGSPSPTKMYPDIYGSPIGGVLLNGAAYPKPVGTPEAQVTCLDTIKESEPDEQVPQPADYRLRSDLFKSRRSVRFATDVPRQPPSSPNCSSQTEVVLQHKGRLVLGMDSLVNNVRESTLDASSLHEGKNASSLPGSRDTRLTSVEPWPQVNEEDFNRTPTPSVTVRSTPTPAELDQSMAVQYDAKSEHSELMSLMQSRESSYHSTKKASMLREQVGESPGPPPPSPEPKDAPEGGASTAEHPFQETPRSAADGSVDLDELIETESEMTISAKPPSNLDDASSIPTPVTPQHADVQSRDVIREVSAVEEDASMAQTTRENLTGRDVIDGNSEQKQESELEKGDTTDSGKERAAEASRSVVDPEADANVGDLANDEEGGDDMMDASTKPQRPAYADPMTSDPALNEALLERTENHPDDKLLHLDHFEADDNTFKAELQQELSRLSQEQELQRHKDDEDEALDK